MRRWFSCRPLLTNPDKDIVMDNVVFTQNKEVESVLRILKPLMEAIDLRTLTRERINRYPRPIGQHENLVFIGEEMDQIIFDEVIGLATYLKDSRYWQDRL
jgi:hypothetical protein